MELVLCISHNLKITNEMKYLNEYKINVKSGLNLNGKGFKNDLLTESSLLSYCYSLSNLFIHIFYFNKNKDPLYP
jgi:hypothetical protein